jgi:hypothetical protein
VLFYNTVGSCQPQSSAFSYILRGEEGIEDPGEVLFRNTLTGIGELYED